jgi:hypothetical protein
VDGAPGPAPVRLGLDARGHWRSRACAPGWSVLPLAERPTLVEQQHTKGVPCGPGTLHTLELGHVQLKSRAVDIGK